MTKIQKAEVQDVPVLLPLIAAYWEFESLSGFETQRLTPPLERLLSDPKLGTAWIAWDGNVAVGYLLAVYVFSLEHQGLTAEIDEFFVLPSWRHGGAGSELLRVAESEFVRQGCTNVALQLSRENAAARQFYHRHGFKERAGYELLDKALSADQPRKRNQSPSAGPPLFDTDRT